MSKSDEISKLIAKTDEVRAKIERALAPSRSMADLVKAIHPPAFIADLTSLSKAIQPLSHITDIAKAMQPPTHLTAVSQMMTAMQREHHLLTEFARPPRILEDITKQITQLSNLGKSITAPHRELQEMIRSQTSIFESLSAQVAAMNPTEFSIPQFSEATLAYNVASIGLANRMSEIGLLTKRAMLPTRLFEVPKVFTDFVRHTTERLAAAPTPAIALRLRASLNLAEKQLLGIADAISGFITVPEVDEDPDVSCALNAPYSQQHELLNCEVIEDEKDIAVLNTHSLTAQTVQRGRRILELVTQCNEAGKTSEYGVEIFKPTTRLMTVFSYLPWLSATDQWRFGDVIDCLYFIFYEGAGKDNLRFLDKNGGPLTNKDCDLIWCIKHLRNKWSRHDIDHGKDKEIQKSWKELAAKFRWLGLAEYPTEARHFQKLHYKLLELAEVFLMQILNNLKMKP